MLFRFLLYFFIGIIIYRFITSIFAPNKRHQRSYTTNQQTRKEGDVSIKQKASKKKHIGKDEGDYVDYEEV